MVMKRITAFIICLAMFVTAFAFGVVNQKANEVSNIVGAADASAIEILSSPGIIELDSTATTTTYKLTGDLKLDAEKTALSALVAAIAASTPEAPVVFDGQNNTITLPDGATGGLFDTAKNLTIKNLTLEGTINSTEGHIGAFIADITDEATVVNFDNVSSNVTINHTGNTKNDNIGGVVGQINVLDATLNLTNCTFNNTINATAKSIAGVVGQTNKNPILNINECAFNDVIINDGGANAGGIVGMSNNNTGKGPITINNSVITSYVEGKNNVGMNIGGVIGRSVYDCPFNLGNVIIGGAVIGEANKGSIGVFNRGCTNIVVLNSCVLAGVSENMIVKSATTPEPNPDNMALVSFATADDETLGIFNATADQSLYDVATAIATAMGETAKLGAIITLDSYVAKNEIEFTHESLDAFYAKYEEAITAKNPAVTKLYVETSAVALADTANEVKLEGATAGTNYTAKAFINIGDAYIYSAIAE